MNLNKLTSIIDESGIKKAKLCEDLGISDSSLRNKLKGKTEGFEVLTLDKLY